MFSPHRISVSIENIQAWGPLAEGGARGPNSMLWQKRLSSSSSARPCVSPVPGPQVPQLPCLSLSCVVCSPASPFCFSIAVSMVWLRNPPALFSRCSTSRKRNNESSCATGQSGVITCTFMLQQLLHCPRMQVLREARLPGTAHVPQENWPVCAQ